MWTGEVGGSPPHWHVLATTSAEYNQCVKDEVSYNCSPLVWRRAPLHAVGMYARIGSPVAGRRCGDIPRSDSLALLVTRLRRRPAAFETPTTQALEKHWRG